MREETCLERHFIILVIPVCDKTTVLLGSKNKSWAIDVPAVASL